MSTRPEHDASASPARRAGESAEDIFARIQRHRRAGTADDSSLRNDEFPKTQSRQLVDFEVVDDAAPDQAADDPDAGQFPRSMTMRTLTRYPAIGLLIAAPAVGVLLRNPGIRQSLYRVGRMLVEQQMWAQIERLTRDRTQDRDRS